MYDPSVSTLQKDLKKGFKSTSILGHLFFFSFYLICLRNLLLWKSLTIVLKFILLSSKLKLTKTWLYILLVIYQRLCRLEENFLSLETFHSQHFSIISILLYPMAPRLGEIKMLWQSSNSNSTTWSWYVHSLLVEEAKILQGKYWRFHSTIL